MLKPMLSVLLLAASLAASLAAQEVAFQPRYWVGAGAAYNYYAAPRTAAGWLSMAVRVADRTYSFSSLDMTQQAAFLRTGAARILSQPGRWTLAAVVDGGIQTGGGITVSSFSAQPIILYDLLPRSEHVYITFAVGLLTVGTQLQPVVRLGIGKAF